MEFRVNKSFKGPVLGWLVPFCRTTQFSPLLPFFLFFFKKKIKNKKTTLISPLQLIHVREEEKKKHLLQRVALGVRRGAEASHHA